MTMPHRLFDRLVFSKVRHAFGGRIRFFISGSAPLNRDIGEWFHAAGLLILEGYGLTETAGGAFINRPDNYKLGTVGLAVRRHVVRIGDDGEVQVNGARRDGRLPQPAGQDSGRRSPRTAGCAPGTRAQFDADGFLTITGRIKEMFKTSGGKYVVPPAIEAKFIALCPYASQFLVFGEARNFCVALDRAGPRHDLGLGREHGLGGKSYAELVKSPAVHELIGEHVSKLNAELNRWETIKKWALLDHDLSVERGELTPSLKVKRSVVADQNKHMLDALYT